MAIAPEQAGIGIRRRFTTGEVHPYDMVEWERRDARITNYRDGAVAFEQEDVEFPVGWSLNATNIVSQKYFRGTLGTPERESSLRDVADRVIDTITEWGRRDGYFTSDEEADAFSDEMKYAIITQRMAFNSPVWFNIGVEGVPQQASACFILHVEDTMDAILNWYVEEGTIFKGGSGSGVNMSKIRSSFEPLKGGGTASGPVSFMRGADASAGTIKSGGKTRRAAKMVILDVGHPDVEEFIWCKANEERKAHVLRDAGFDMDLDGSDIHSIQYQNANNSVRVTDEFMQAVENDDDWHLRAVTTGEIIRTVRARDLMRQFAQASWECADPGMQYDTTINNWHTASNTDRINGSNPCSEYMHLDNSACNLASLNLMKFLDDAGNFDVEGFKHIVECTFTAQEILVGNADYPTEPIGENARRFRQLGLGYANLGAMLMAQGLPYDSDVGRSLAAAVTSLMTGHAYATSARIASRMGPFAGYGENVEPMLRVLDQHREAASRIDEEAVPSDLLDAARRAWDEACDIAADYGVRNSQASVLAPTGTIGLMMDCDTTGIEPDLGLVKTKTLVGGGTMSIINQTVPRALRHLGYDNDQIAEIDAYIAENASILGAPHVAPEHVSVFACSMGDNVIHHLGHVKMMGAVQPFISGAISKCVVGDTLLSTADGLVRIGALRRGERPDSFRDEVIEVASLGGTAKTDAFYYGGPRPVRGITLRSGHQVSGTHNHRVLTAAAGGFGWKRLDEIEVGDAVAVEYGSDLWSPIPARFDGFAASEHEEAAEIEALPQEITDELGFLLGAFASQGHITRSDWTVHISHSDPMVLERVRDAWIDLFGVRASISAGGGRDQQVSVASRAIVEFFDHLGCGGCPCDKRIPDAVLRSPRSAVLAFLSGLVLDAEVSASGEAGWTICCDSDGLLDDLQAVLTNLGIVHDRSTRYAENGSDLRHVVHAHGRHARRLMALVPFADSAMQAQADRLARMVRDDRHDAADVVPGITPAELYSLIPEGVLTLNSHNAKTEFGHLDHDRTTQVDHLDLAGVAAIPGISLPGWLRTVIDDDLHFSPVESVSDSAILDVYDVSVPTTQAFVGNGIVNHNTVNMPEEATVEEVESLHIDAWKLGLKAIAIYRDNCKVAQPMSASRQDAGKGLDADAAAQVEIIEKVVEKIVEVPVREKLPRTRRSQTFEFRVADCKGFVTVGEYEDGRPGEIFVRVSKQGSTLAGIMDAFAIAISHGLQYGVPLRSYIDAFTGMRFEPAGMTDDPDIRIANSLMDYLFRRLGLLYLSAEERAELNIFTTEERMQPTLPGVEETAVQTVQGSDLPADPPSVESASQLSATVARGSEARGSTGPEGASKAVDAPICMQCGVRMQRAGSCHACPSCGNTSGCS